AGECRRPAKATDLTRDPTTCPPARRHGRDFLRYRLAPLRAPCALTHQRPYASGARSWWRGGCAKLTRRQLAAAGHLGPGVAQADRAVEHRPLRGGVLVRTEIAEPLELYRIIGIASGERRLDAGVRNHFERIGIDVGGKIRRA